MRLISIFAAILAATVGTDKASNDESQGRIRVMPVSATPEPDSIILRIARPKSGASVRGRPVWIQFRIDGYSLGTASQFDRADEIAVSDMGQTVHVVIDDHPYFAIKDEALNPFNEYGNFYDTSYKFQSPFDLKEGVHFIQVFPAHSFGESLKGENTYDANVFYVGSKTEKLPIDLSKPYLTYNEPSDQLHLVEGQPVLLDFLLNHTDLTSDGYRVRLSVDGHNVTTISSWQPYYIYGLKKGGHTVRLELLDPNGKVAPGSYNDVRREIEVYSS